MQYLSITCKAMNQEQFIRMKELLSTYVGKYDRLYRSQIKFTGNESKRWQYIFIYALIDGVKPEILQSIEISISALQDSVIRIEIMQLTPDSFLRKKTDRKGIAILEHVLVQEEYLDDFQTIMINNNTPAMKYIIEQKDWCYEFIALETKDILFHDDAFKQWNQIHLIEMNLRGLLRYKHDFEEGLRLAGAPDFQTNFDHLETIREFTYKYKGKRL